MRFAHLSEPPFHRYDDDEGSRSVAERFVTVIITKSSQAAMSVMYIVTTSKQQKAPPKRGRERRLYNAELKKSLEHCRGCIATSEGK